MSNFDVRDVGMKALEVVNFGVIVFDHAQRIVLWNEWMARHSSLPGNAVLGKTFREIFSNSQNSRVHIAIQTALVDNLPSFLSQALNGAPFALFGSQADALKNERIQQSIQVLPIRDKEKSNHCLLQIMDVSDTVIYEKLLQAQMISLKSESRIDELTGIPNKRSFDEQLLEEFNRAKRTGRSLALILIDIDNFKRYNDSYGQPAGDQCLIKIANAMVKVLKRPADIVTRCGGEEFAIILPDTDEAGAQKVAESARSAIESLQIKHETSRTADFITISLGATAKTPGRSDDISNFMIAAERLLHLAKFSGKNQVR